MKDIANKGRALINQNDKVLLLKSYHAVTWVEFQDIKNFQFPKNSQLMAKDQCYITKNINDCQYRDINASIPKDLPNPYDQLDYFTFIYQEKSNNDNNKLMVFNIMEFDLPEHYSINATPAGCDFIFEDEEGYNTFMITRSSEIEVTEDVQRARY